ncbi:S41 family peptidase [Candidatus Saccharibacteria bacterium]|nr:S41 family peptidase [Candidatus Saccharibacteria bacterium]
MDYVNPEVQEHSPSSSKRWPVFKILAVFFLTLAVFGLGLEIGRGKLYVRGLSTGESKTSAAQLDYTSVDQLYTLLRNDYDGTLDQNKLLDGVKSGLISATGDPYTQYFNPDEAKTFNDQLSGSFTGIGAELGTDADNNIVIVSPLAGYPAEKAGLKPKDIIVGIDGQTTAGLSVDKVVQKIRGPADSKVTLTIVRSGVKPIEVTVTRAKITIASVESKVEAGIGYLKITQFTDDTPNLAKKAADSFRQQAVKAVVLDLRGNPGGYLNGAVDISSLWLEQGKTVVSERRGDKILSTDYAKGNNVLKGLPTVVLINGGSASASEITAGALRDNGVASLVGDKSFGKGSVQQVERLSGGGELKVTIARWYTPSGKNIDKQGINPDISVNSTDDDQKAGRDPQKDRAIQILQSKIGGQ